MRLTLWTWLATKSLKLTALLLKRRAALLPSTPRPTPPNRSARRRAWRQSWSRLGA